MVLTDQRGRQEGRELQRLLDHGLALYTALVMTWGLVTRVWSLACVHVLVKERGQELGGIKRAGGMWVTHGCGRSGLASPSHPLLSAGQTLSSYVTLG